MNSFKFDDRAASEDFAGVPASCQERSPAPHVQRDKAAPPTSWAPTVVALIRCWLAPCAVCKGIGRIGGGS